MELLKTTILPTDDKKLAVSMFRQLIFERPAVLMVVRGKDTEAETFVQRADRLAGDATDPRWVVWARKPEQIEEVVQELEGPKNLLDEIPTSRGFSLSLTDEVRDVITGSEPVPDLVRVLKAFAKAETKSR